MILLVHGGVDAVTHNLSHWVEFALALGSEPVTLFGSQKQVEAVCGDDVVLHFLVLPMIVPGFLPRFLYRGNVLSNLASTLVKDLGSFS